MTVNKENIIKIQMTKDLEIEFDFSKKHLFVYSNNWKVKTLAVQEEKPKEEKVELPSNKKVRPSKGESQLSKFIQVFSQLAEADHEDEGVPLSEIKNAMFGKKLVERTAELNNLLNDALSNDMIEETEIMGHYRRKQQ